MRGEAHLDVEATFSPGVRCEGRAVHVGDGADDGQAQSVPAGVADSVGAEALERLEKPVHLTGWDDRSGVADRQGRLSFVRSRGDLHTAAVEVVPDGVVYQVRDQVGCQLRVAGSRGCVQLGVDADAAALGFLVAVHDRVPGDLGEVKRLPLLDPALAAGQREQSVDQAFLLIAQCQ